MELQAKIWKKAHTADEGREKREKLRGFPLGPEEMKEADRDTSEESLV